MGLVALLGTETNPTARAVRYTEAPGMTNERDERPPPGNSIHILPAGRVTPLCGQVPDDDEPCVSWAERAAVTCEDCLAAASGRYSPPFVSSVRVERSSGPHEYVSIWLRGQNVGTLCVRRGDGDELRRLLLHDGDATRAEIRDCRAELVSRRDVIGLALEAQRELQRLTKQAARMLIEAKAEPTGERYHQGRAAALEELLESMCPPEDSTHDEAVNTTGPMAFAKCDRRADVAHYDALLGTDPDDEREP